MQRVYFLAPDLDTTRKMVDDLLLARVEERHIHVLARRDAPLADLPEAGLLQKTDLLPALRQGVVVGGLTGMLVGVLAPFVIGDVLPTGGAILVLSLVGAILGAWWSSMIGSSAANRNLKGYKSAIDRGQILVMADVPAARIKDIEERIHSRHPSAS